ncbi:MAG: hypothetical protein P4L98_21765 [Ancalomicrobiaceae bacterium]|nr:hypothetical protein [Ancalomicrobiaceae bacterium]
MRIEVRLDRTLVRNWQQRLIERLGTAGHAVSVVAEPAAMPVPAGLYLVERLERLILGRASPFGRRLGAEQIRRLTERPRQEPIDLILDLANPDGHDARDKRPRIVLSIDGLPPEPGLAAALLDRRPPFIDLDLICPDGGPTRLVTGLPAVPEADVFTRAIHSVAARVVGLTLQAVEVFAAGGIGVAIVPRPEPRSASSIGAAAFAFAGLPGKIALRLRRLVVARREWVVGWRRIRGDAVADTLAWPADDYAWLADDGQRYYADPHLHIHNGRPYLFVEEFPYATGKGILSASEWTGDGWTVPRPILEEAHHLSWPHVFAHDGQIWMVPESGGKRTLDLYRAVDFPYHWERADRLVDGRSLSDATFLRRADGWWLLAGCDDEYGAAPYDGLTLMHSDSLLSGWRPAGPPSVLVDARSARPAGKILSHGDAAIRVTQDCTTSYGAALCFARIDRLEDGILEQTIVKRLPPQPDWQAIGVHTLNSAGDLEVIDINRGREIVRSVPLGWTEGTLG